MDKEQKQKEMHSHKLILIVKFAMIKKFAEKVWLYIYESLYSKETLSITSMMSKFDDEYIESEKV